MNNLFNINIDSADFGFNYWGEFKVLPIPHTVESINFKGGFSGDSYETVQFENDNSVSYNGVYRIIEDSASYFDNSVKTAQATPMTSEDLLKLKILFPDFAIEKYENEPNYVVKAYTYVNGLEILLCQKLISRIEALGTDGEYILYNQRYCEEISFNILNPLKICFDSNWAYFRENVCKWHDLSIASSGNSESCVLRVELIPVILNNDGTYSENEKYSGGSNSIMLGGGEELKSEISLVNGNLQAELTWGNIQGTISQYVSKVYGETLDHIKYLFRIFNEDLEYIPFDEVTIDSNSPSWTSPSGISVEYNPDPALGWADYTNGFVAKCYFQLYKVDDGEEVLIKEIDSNVLSLTPEKWSLLVAGETNISTSEFENIDNLNMNIDVANIIQNNIIEVAKPTDSESHIVTPVFIRTTDAQNIDIYTKVTQNLTLRLDAYKSSVRTFILQIEGVEFPEVARIPYGIVFKVIGSSLPQVELNGTYYILNEDRVLVTTGKYTYIQ